MKIKIKNNNNLINFNLLNFRLYLGLKKNTMFFKNIIYLKGFKLNFCIYNLSKISKYLKKSLKLVYEYHYSNSKILFVGFTNNILFNFSFIIDKTGHYSISKNEWVNNSITNKITLFKILKKQAIKKLKKKDFNSMKKLQKKLQMKFIPDLIVIYNKKENLKAFKESLNFNKPSIIFINSSDFIEEKTYNIPGGFQLNSSEKLCYFFIKSILMLPKKKHNFYEKKNHNFKKK